MLAILEVLLQLATAAWTWATTNLVPADAASTTLVHVALWAPLTMGAVGWVVGLVTRRGGSRR